MLGRDWWLERQATQRSREITPRGDLAENETSTIALFQAASPSVVYITSLQSVQRNFFSFDIQKIPRGTGTGFIWNSSGHVVTNFHVIQESSEAQVTLADQSVWEAKVIGAEPDKDIAVLKINAPEELLAPLQVGQSSDLQVGQSVFAIGNPFGLDQTLTTGVISGLGREIQSVTQRPIQGVIQTDAAINPGNSGGPLLDSAGRLIGVNTAIYSPSGAYAGIGFAVPVDTVNRIVPQLIQYGRAIRPVLGVELFDDAFARRFDIRGVVVARVIEQTGAAQSGLQGIRYDRYGRILLGDIITEIEGTQVEDQNSLYRILDRFQVGDAVELKVSRQGERPRSVEVTLTANRP
jgi:S1-C subfamily serine protease